MSDSEVIELAKSPEFSKRDFLKSNIGFKTFQNSDSLLDAILLCVYVFNV